MSMTTNPPSTVDEESFTVTRTIRIAASADTVWQAVTRPEHIARWFGRPELDGEGAGAVGTITFDGYGTVPLRVEAVDEPHSITYAWGNDDAKGPTSEQFDAARATVFTFTLEPFDGGTQLTVVETGFERTSAPLENLRSHANGWVEELDKLVALLESAS